MILTFIGTPGGRSTFVESTGLNPGRGSLSLLFLGLKKAFIEDLL